MIEKQPIEKRFCSHCNESHPLSAFQEGQSVCRKARREKTQALAAENRRKSNDPGYTKICGRGDKCVQGAGKQLLAREHFYVDVSRPDGFFLYCNACQKADRDKRPQLIGKMKEFRDNLIRTVLKVIKDHDRSLVRQIVEDFRHENSPVNFAGREWQIQILNDMRPNVAVRKPSQKGLTWLLERFIIALLLRYKDRPYEYRDHLGKKRQRFIEAIYSFETKSKASDWSSIRLEKVKQDNQHVRDALKEASGKKVERTLLMKFGRTALHLVGRATVSGVLTISADIVVIDEKDRDANPDVSSQIGSRTLESPFMNTPSTKGITRETSTPEVSGAGISLQYEHSDQAEWEIYCENCLTWQVMIYPECIGNFYEKGDDPQKDENGNTLVPYWQCVHCKEPIDWKAIGKWSADDPDYYENCRWVVQNPEKYDPVTGAGIGGYQVPFAGPERSAAFFLAERDDPEHDIRYLYNHLVGLPYDDLNKTLTIDNFKRRAGVAWGYTQNDIYVLGCDHHPAQGGFIVIYRQVPGSVRPAIPEGKWELAYLEHVQKNRDLFDEFDDDSGKVKKGRLYELILEYNIMLAVVDLEPDTNEVEKMIEEFSFGKTVWADKSGMFADTFRIDEEGSDGTVICRIYEDKVGALDWYFNRIRFGYLVFPEDVVFDNDRHRRDFFDAHTNLYKGEVENKRAGNTIQTGKLASQNVREVYKKRQGKVNDHWAMAGKFAAQATRTLVAADLSRTGIVPPTIRGMGRIPGT